MDKVDPSTNSAIAYDDLLNQLAELATDPNTAASTFFDHVVTAIDVICSPQGFAIVGIGVEDTLMFIEGTPQARSNISSWKLLDHLGQSTTAQGQREWQNGKDLFYASSIETPQRTWGWLVIQCLADENQALAKQLVSAVSEIVAEFVAINLLADKSKQVEFLDSYARFSLNAHSSFETKPVAYAIANDLRLLTSCERVSIFQVTENHARLLAVSSVSAAENRTKLAKKMKQLVTVALRYKTGFSTDQRPEQPKLVELLEEFTALSRLPNATGIPITSGKKNRTIGFVVTEATEKLDRFAFSRGLTFAMPHVRLAMQNTRQQEYIPFRKTLLWIGRFFDSVGFFKPLAAAAVIAVFILALFFVKTDFKIRIEGQLRPVEEQTIFSPADGFVDTMKTGHGDLVSVGDELLTLRSPELEIKIEKNAGEFERLNQLLESKRIELNQAMNGTADPLMQSKIAAEISDLNQQYQSLESEKKFLLDRKKELRLTSPIEGKVITWNVKRSLSNKPVRWGEPLFDVAMEEGEWHIVFKVPESDFGYISSAQSNEAMKHPLRVNYFLESDTNSRFETEIIESGKAAEFEPELGSFVLVRCKAPDQLSDRRHGARVIADVYCGRRSIAYVWTRELWDGIRRRFVW